MRIAFIVNTFPALSETFILTQITGLIDYGLDIHIFAFQSSDTCTLHDEITRYNLMNRFTLIKIPKNIPGLIIRSFSILVQNIIKHPRLVFRLIQLSRRGRKKSLRTLCALPFFIKNGYVDIFHCHFGPNGSFAVDLRDLLSVKSGVVTTFHGYDMTRYIRDNGEDIYRELFAKGDLFLPVSERWKKQLISMGCPEDRVRVHRMGIDLHRFRFRIRKRAQDEPIRILTVGRLVEKKGIEYAIYAVSQLVSFYPEIDICYEIVGDGPLMGRFKQLIADLGDNAGIRLLGWQDQNKVSALMDRAHLFLAPSVTASNGDQEGLPVVLMESLAKGLIVCSTIHSAIPELITDGINGFLVPERDVAALVDKLKYIIDSEAVWPEISRRGFEIVKNNHDIDVLNNQLVELFKEAII